MLKDKRDDRERARRCRQISPELLAELKKEDMQQAVVERFRKQSEAPDTRRPPATARARPTGVLPTKSARPNSPVSAEWRSRQSPHKISNERSSSFLASLLKLLKSDRRSTIPPGSFLNRLDFNVVQLNPPVCHRHPITGHL